MSRWAPDAAGRLHAAALDLCAEQGFAATTVPQIAARAGLTTRSFFRHFPDKREVLFAGEGELPLVVDQIFRQAEEGLTPLEVIRQGLVTVVAPRLEGLREELIARHLIVASDEGLRERELRKLSILHEAATQAFERRGLSPLDARVAGRLAVAIYDTALETWLDDGGDLGEVMDEVVAAFAAFASGDVARG